MEELQPIHPAARPSNSAAVAIFIVGLCSQPLILFIALAGLKFFRLMYLLIYGPMAAVACGLIAIALSLWAYARMEGPDTRLRITLVTAGIVANMAWIITIICLVWYVWATLE
jgi:hypothetical protein